VDSLIEAITILKDFLEEHAIRYMVIGGVANSVWGEPRATTDADLVLLLGGRSIAEFVELVSTRFQFLRPNPVEFARRTYVVPIQATDDVSADLSLAMLPYEEQAIGRAMVTDIEGVRVPVCTAEDLVIYKAISERAKDWLDIEGILLRQGTKLDRDYVVGWLKQFAQALESPEIVTRYKSLRARVER
jgi:hypothetical protein